VSTLLCITNSLDGVRPCTVRGLHLSTCDGRNTHGGECVGCLPRPAETGILCRSCWERFREAMKVAVDLITHCRSIERGPQSIDGRRTTTVTQPSYPQSWQQADALWMRLAGILVANAADRSLPTPKFPYWTGLAIGFSFSASLDRVAAAVMQVVYDVETEPENIVARIGGAEAAVRFYRDVQTALARYPLEEDPKPVPHLKCRNCKQLSMETRPPLDYEEPLVYKCNRPGCGAEYDPQMKEWDLRLYRTELEDAMRSTVEEAVGLIHVAGHSATYDLYDLTAECDRCGVTVLQRIQTQWYPNTTPCAGENEVAA
jgi:hypothetical protein